MYAIFILYKIYGVMYNASLLQIINYFCKLKIMDFNERTAQSYLSG